ncbi:protein transport protein SEC31-like [Meles meles]|uniref:protein transport protein SEC31-like n=1 Tax=Meles meles TaxID=9662 RepID=UPI001E699D4D|nr:protein transport protein SEC31-like [Meles meles]
MWSPQTNSCDVPPSTLMTVKGRPLPGGPWPSALAEGEGSSGAEAGAEPRGWAPAGRVTGLGRHGDGDAPGSLILCTCRWWALGGSSSPPHPPVSGQPPAGLRVPLPRSTATHRRSLAHPAQQASSSRGSREAELAVSCVCKAGPPRGCGRGGFRPPSLAAVAGQESTPASAIGPLASSGQSGERCPRTGGRSTPLPHGGHDHQLWGGPWGSGLFRPAPHGLSSHIARRRLSFILPAVARLGLLPSYPGLTLSLSPILAGKAGRHSSSGPPGIPSAGGRCQVTADGQRLSWAVGTRAPFGAPGPWRQPLLPLHDCTSRDRGRIQGPRMRCAADT